MAIAREGGEAAEIARKAVEDRTGVPVITSKNAAQLNQVVTDLLKGATAQSEKQDKEQYVLYFHIATPTSAIHSSKEA